MNTSTYISIGILVVASIIVFALTKDENTTAQHSKDRYMGLSKLNEDKDSIKQDDHISVRTDIYDEIQDVDIDRSIAILKEKTHDARRIIPTFPHFPSIWLLPPTDRGKYGSIGERYCIEFLELVFPGYKFVKVRPKWLRNPETNRCLELDGYCDELKLALEYNGIQHYTWPNFTGCSQQEFEKQRYRDQLKEDICKSHDICLIRIPYTVPNDRIPLAVFSKLLDAVPSLH